MRKPSAYAKTKAQISFVVIAPSSVFVKRIVQSLFYIYSKVQASSIFLCLCSSVCVGPIQVPHCRFSHEAAHLLILAVQTVSEHGFEHFLLFLLFLYIVYEVHIRLLVLL